MCEKKFHPYFKKGPKAIWQKKKNLSIFENDHHQLLLVKVIEDQMSKISHIFWLFLKIGKILNASRLKYH